MPQVNNWVDKGRAMIPALRKVGLDVWFANQGDGTVLPMSDTPAEVEAFIAAYDPGPDRKLERVAEVKALLAAKIAAGFSYQGHVYQIDGDAQANMTAVKADFLDGRANAHGGFWRDKANVNVAMTDAEVQAFFSAAKDWKLATVRRAWELIAAIGAAADLAAVDAIDINAGWP